MTSTPLDTRGPAGTGASEIFVARQAVLDRRQEVHGYELLFRSGLDAPARADTPDRASFEMLHTALLGFGLDSLLGDRAGYLPASRDVLLQEFYLILPKERTVLQVAEGVAPDDQVVTACRVLRERGYSLAIDDFLRRPDLLPLATLADVMRVDYTGTPEAERRAIVREFLPRKVRLLATNVDTRLQFADAAREGFTHFQGYFFAEPELLSTPDVPAYKRNCMRFMTELHRPELNFDRLDELIRQEVALTVKLLRYLNSAGFGWRHEVTSIKQALRVLGEDATRKWCSLIALTVMGGDKPAQVVQTSMLRAALAEQVGTEAGLAGLSLDLFLTGMLSTIDVLLGRPMEEALAQMPLSVEVRNTLLGKRTRLSTVWQLVLAYERADWPQVKELAQAADLSPGRLPFIYRNAVQWVDRIYKS